MLVLMPVIFVVGIVLIALEDIIRVNKSATALLMSLLLWLMLMFNSDHLLDVTLHDDFQRYTQREEITHLFLPALINLLVVLGISHFWLFKKGTVLRQSRNLSADELYLEKIPQRSRVIIFWIGILSLCLVPLFQSITHLPAFMCVLLGLVLLWIYTDLSYGKIRDIVDSDKLRIPNLSRSVDIPTIFFFFGILMSVAAMNVSGQLLQFSSFLTSWVSEPYLLSIIIGAVSSLIDNVALVSATMAMFPLPDSMTNLTPYMQYFMADGGFWTLLAYTGVTGGSILIIGSATGVAVMGLEKISFGYYLKRFTPLAILGYVAGILVFLLLS